MLGALQRPGRILPDGPGSKRPRQRKFLMFWRIYFWTFTALSMLTVVSAALQPQTQGITDWVAAGLIAHEKLQVATNGRSRLKRLNRVEYVNTLRDFQKVLHCICQKGCCCLNGFCIWAFTDCAVMLAASWFADGEATGASAADAWGCSCANC